MAYHLGRLLHLHFGYDLYTVATQKTTKLVFTYDIKPQAVTIRQMENMIGQEDLLVVNPSFSRFLFGLRLPGRKIMYVQDFRTFAFLDAHCDLYVAVSSVVQRFLQGVYNIPASVIPPFIDLDSMPPAMPWDERPAGSALIYVKNNTPEHKQLLQAVDIILKNETPHIRSRLLQGRGMPHRRFLKTIGTVRYFINLSLAEGFGLVPLEAMAMGSMVTGTDGLAGVDYMQNGKNCLVGSIRNLRPLADILHNALSDHSLAMRCVEGGLATAQHYGYTPFKEAWLNTLSEFLRCEPSYG